MLTGETENRAIIITAAWSTRSIVGLLQLVASVVGGLLWDRIRIRFCSRKFTRKRSWMVQQPGDARSRHGLHIQSSVIEAEGNVKPIGTRICLAR